MNYITSHNFVRQNDKLCLLKKIRRSSNFFLIVNYKVSSRNEYISKRESLRTTTYQHCRHSVTATDHRIISLPRSGMGGGRCRMGAGIPPWVQVSCLHCARMPNLVGHWKANHQQTKSILQKCQNKTIINKATLIPLQ